MKISRTALFHRSRDRRFLIRGALTIALISVVIAIGISVFTTRSEFRALVPELKDIAEGIESVPEPEVNTRDVNGWAALIRFVAMTVDEDFIAYHRSVSGRELPGSKQEPEANPGDPLKTLTTQIEESELPSPDQALLIGLARGLLGEETKLDGPIKDLREIAAENPPRQLAAEALGDVLSRAGDWDGAIDAYRLEVDRFPDDAGRALHLLAVLLRREGHLEEYGKLMDHPELRENLTLQDRIDHAIAQHDYIGLLGLIVSYDLNLRDPWLVCLSLFAAVIWFIIISQFSGAWRSKGLWYLAAFVLGYFSATGTLFVGTIQEKILNFTHDPNGNIVDQLLYCVAGIGLREETLKLLLFVPLAPLLAHRGEDIDALICAGIVGLGFAFNENIGYIGRGSEFETWGRFLTANFFHIALTGVAGLSLVRFWRWPKRQWDNFLYDFLLVVAAHGAYDALLLIPPLMEYGIIAIIIYAVIAYLFLDQAIHLMRPQSSMTISPLAVFVLGSALLMGVVLCFACWAVPFPKAFSQYTAGLGGMIPIAFIFINRLRAL